MTRILNAAGLVSFMFLALSVSAADPPGPRWIQLAEKATGERTGSVLLHAAGEKRMLLLGKAEDAPFVQAFDPAARVWSAISSAEPAVERFHPYYQAAYDPGTRTVYCLSGRNVTQCFRLADGTWKSLSAARELEGLSWHALACDTRGGKLVVVGADKRADNIGWMRTVVYDIARGEWRRLDVADEDVRRIHGEFVALKEAAIDLIGRIRLAWFRDPGGVGTDGERRDLAARCKAIAARAQAAPFAADVAAVAACIGERRTLDALKAARALQRRIEEAAEAQYPVPCARRNSPLAFDERNGVFVLFGGDHEDYLMNDTWVLDLAKGSWRRMAPERAPHPRAGHALFALPAAGGVALYEGYEQTNSTDYGAAPYRPAGPVELWRYDPAADRWDLLGSWPHPRKPDAADPPPVGHFYGYAAEYYSPPAIAADGEDRIVLAAHPGRVWFLPWKEFPARTWMLSPDLARPDAEGRRALGTPPNQRLYRTGAFLAAYGEVADPPKDTGLDKLPANRWIRLPDPPRNPCYGCRQRDWGTAVWDSDRDQILLWGGGHCVRSASVVAHYSPASGRLVEGYDADEPYGANGGGGFDSSLWNRPWVSTHSYNHYAYDPACRMLVSGRGYLYDPDRMDWIRAERIALPFTFEWGHTVVEASAHGAVAWAKKKGSDAAGLWLFDRERGWVDLEPGGALFTPYCDAHGMVYDSKRDRMILGGVGAAYEKRGSGALLAFDFKSRSIETIAPKNADLGRTRNAREMAYIDHADWILFGELLRQGDEEKGKPYTRIYDCARDAIFLLDAGEVAAGHSAASMYDARRKLAYVFTFRGEAWALRIDPATARLLEKPEG